MRLAGEEPRPAAEVRHPVAGLHVPLRDPVGMVKELPEAGGEVACLFRREDLVMRQNNPTPSERSHPSTRNALKQRTYSGSGIREHQLSCFLINHDLLVFIYCPFQDHF